MSNNVLTTLNKALSLATKLQHTHEDLCSWLEKVEYEVVQFGAQEPVGEQLTQVQERQKVSTHTTVFILPIKTQALPKSIKIVEATIKNALN